MEPDNRLTELDPRPMWSPAPSDHGVRRRSQSPLIPAEGFGGTSPEGIALRMGPEGQIPDHPGSVAAFGPPGSEPMPPQEMFPPPTGPVPMTAAQYMQGRETWDIDSLRRDCQRSFLEYLAVQHQYKQFGGNVSERLRSQTDLVLSDLLSLQMEVRDLQREAQNHRWRKWFMGGIFVSFIPLVRRIFRRGNDVGSKVAANDTEYAFQRSRSILARIKDSVFGVGRLASIGFFVFGVLYTFQNEVSLRVARTIQRRIRQLSDRIHEGDYTLEERDMRVLEGWRWRILI